MELELLILDGNRSGEVITLPDIKQPIQENLPWILEDERIEFRLRVPRHFANATLELYQHAIEATHREYPDTAETTEFVWTPKTSNYRTEKLFSNYFGISELTVLLHNDGGETVELVAFQPLQVAAKATSADNVERMFEYLAGISSDALHSVFSATRYSAGFNEGSVSPAHTLERIERSIELLVDSLPIIINKPITRLVPEQRMVPPTGGEEMDDSTIGWLLENLSVLEPDENPDQAHILYEGEHFRASSLRMPVLLENPDVYENWIIHGYVDLLLREAQQLAQKYQREFKGGSLSTLLPRGYISFFDKVSKFKSHLIGAHVTRIDRLIDNLKQIKTHFETRLPVSRSLNERPIITPKTRSNHVYMEIFIDIIRWHQRGAIDWSAYENLFAIQSIPDLFEAYCYFRVVQSVNIYFNPNLASSDSIRNLETVFTDSKGIQLIVEREPVFWTPLNSAQHPHGLVNSEAYSVKNNSYFKERGQFGINSKRVPDIVIQLLDPETGDIRLLVMDAKYTNRNWAFVYYLPELTMKYVHGIHHPGQKTPTVNSLTILYTEKEMGDLASYHHGEMGIHGSNPVSPNLQSVGLILGAKRESDPLQKLITRLLEINGIKRAGLTLLSDRREVA